MFNLVANSLESAGEHILGRVKFLSVVRKAVDMAVLPSQDHRTGRRADGVGAKGPVENHAFGREAIQIRGCPVWPPVGSRCGCGMVIRVKEKDVGPRRGAADVRLLPPAPQQGNEEQGNDGEESQPSPSIISRQFSGMSPRLFAQAASCFALSG